MRNESRFEIISKRGIGMMSEAVILQDRQTGVQYLFFQRGYAGGLTPLLDREGKPIVGTVYDN